MHPYSDQFRLPQSIVQPTFADRKNTLTKHPDKTFIRRIEKGFDFLGYQFSRAGLSIARDTVERFVERATRLYEREQHGSDGTPLLGMYVRRWVRWALCGLGDKQKPRTEAGLCIWVSIVLSRFTPAEPNTC